MLVTDCLLGLSLPFDHQKERQDKLNEQRNEQKRQVREIDTEESRYIQGHLTNVPFITSAVETERNPSQPRWFNQNDEENTTASVLSYSWFRLTHEERVGSNMPM
jgi:hypothetical protein